MQRVTSFLFLLVFLTAQYERYISYLECRLAIYLNKESDSCDCEKILLGKAATGDVTSQPAQQPHTHPDESYIYPPVEYLQHCLVQLDSKNRLLPSYQLPIAPVIGIDHPPQV